MHWYKIAVNEGKDEPYHFVGASNETLDGLVQKAGRGEYIHLTNLLYSDRGDMRSWEDWDASIEPGVYINPSHIYTIMQFKGDPRTTPRR